MHGVSSQSKFRENVFMLRAGSRSSEMMGERGHMNSYWHGKDCMCEDEMTCLICLRNKDLLNILGMTV